MSFSWWTASETCFESKKVTKPNPLDLVSSSRSFTIVAAHKEGRDTELSNKPAPAFTPIMH